MQFPYKLIISFQVQVELFTSLTPTSPYFSLSPLKEACPDMSSSLLSLFNPFLQTLATHTMTLKSHLTPRLKGQVTSYTQ